MYKNLKRDNETDLEFFKKKSYEELDEVKILQHLHQLEAGDPDTPEWHALAAAARYNRKQEIDEITQSHLNNIFENEKITSFSCEVFLNITLENFRVRWFTEEFPKLRETDHSQGKKKKLERIRHQLREALKKAEQFETIQLQAENACVHGKNTGAQQRVKQLLQLLPSITSSLKEAEMDVESYISSISGIYSSQEKKEKLHAQLEEILELTAQWENNFSQEKNSDSEALDDLHRMIGLTEVKQKVELYYYYLQYEKERQKRGLPASRDQSFNMVLTGNPGTGKTTIARLLAKIYYQLGLLPREEVVETDRSRLVGSYVGQTEEKTLQVIEEAAGGVLFIDEAHTLSQENGKNDYGQTAVDTLVAAMTSGEYAGTFAVILAGYPEEMRGFLNTNTGLRSRFPQSNHIQLPDYSMEELIQIGEQSALDLDFTLTEAAYRQLRRRLEKDQVDESFGNARAVHQLIQEAIFYQGAKAAKENNYADLVFTVLTEDAFLQDKDAEVTAEPMQELEKLIGLERVKKEVKQLTSFVQVQQEREKESLPSVPVQLHALFTGPPGTGKTTVAEIFSRILFQLGFLKRGHLITAGRSDLVAGFAGQTALKTKKIVQEALGGVLFIDEAYSLLGGSSDNFGAEAVDTLVEEMTKHENNLVIIFAGYEQPIQRLMQSNPGLSSRFKKTIQFPAYEENELMEILEFYTGKYGYELADGVKTKLQAVITDAAAEGNARAVKDMVEDAIQTAAYHYMHQQDARTQSVLKAEDFIILQEDSDV